MTNFKKLTFCSFFIFICSTFTLNAAHHGEKKTSTKVYEMRTYYAHEGKLDDLKKRFRDHTDAIFTRLGMKSIAYWTPTTSPGADNTLIYILEHDSEQDAKLKWKTFVADPAWKKAYKASKVNGPLVEKIDVVFMKTTDFSAAL